MRDTLPQIDIAVPEEPRAFVDKLAQLASGPLFQVELREGHLGTENLYVGNFRFLGATPHEGLGAQLMASSNIKERVAVELRAHRWSPDPPTFVAYGSAAKELLHPLLRQYNSNSHTRLRLRIQSERQLLPKLPPRSEELFQRFVNCANTSALHPLDWCRFYEFVQGSRSRPVDHESMTRLLSKSGFDPEYALEIATIYEHLCQFKCYK